MRDMFVAMEVFQLWSGSLNVVKSAKIPLRSVRLSTHQSAISPYVVTTDMGPKIVYLRAASRSSALDAKHSPLGLGVKKTVGTGVGRIVVGEAVDGCAVGERVAFSGNVGKVVGFDEMVGTKVGRLVGARVGT